MVSVAVNLQAGRRYRRGPQGHDKSSSSRETLFRRRKQQENRGTRSLTWRDIRVRSLLASLLVSLCPTVPVRRTLTENHLYSETPESPTELRGRPRRPPRLHLSASPAGGHFVRRCGSRRGQGGRTAASVPFMTSSMWQAGVHNIQLFLEFSSGGKQRQRGQQKVDISQKTP